MLHKREIRHQMGNPRYECLRLQVLVCMRNPVLCPQDVTKECPPQSYTAQVSAMLATRVLFRRPIEVGVAS